MSEHIGNRCGHLLCGRTQWERDIADADCALDDCPFRYEPKPISLGVAVQLARANSPSTFEALAQYQRAALDVAEAQLTQAREALAAADAALEQAERDMQSVTVFVTSRERTKEPEGREWWAESMSDVRCARAQIAQALGEKG